MLKNVKIEKRDGRVVEFDEKRIEKALYKAFINTKTDNFINDEKLKVLVNNIINKIEANKLETINVELIQDMVEQELIEQHESEVAKNYILYRSKRTQVREDQYSLMNEYKDITFGEAEDVDGKRENANVDGNTAMGTMLQYGSAGSKRFGLKYVFSELYAEAHKNGDIHIHDLDFASIGTSTCCQLDIVKLLKNGFGTGHGHLREPQDIISYTALAAIAIQSNQNDQHGGQSIPNFDYGLSEGVKKTFAKTYKEEMLKFLIIELNGENEEEIIEFVNNNIKRYDEDGPYPSLDQPKNEQYQTGEKLLIVKFLLNNFSEENSKNIAEKAQKFAYQFAKKITIKKTYQAMEAFIHNLNSMHSRAGAQVPFSSVNFGTDTSVEGRLVTEQFLLATEAGLGNGETAIFPISIFKVKEGINYNSEDINYDLFKLACRVSAKRLFPNFSFLDAPFNKQYYKLGKPETEAVYMGCRTRVIGSVFPESDGVTFGRGNISFTTINLPRIAIKHINDNNLDGFYKDLEDMLSIAAEQMLERYKLQTNKKVKNFPFLMGQGNWFGSDELNVNDKVGDVLKHGTLSLGFIGLAETLTALTGKHHGESEDSQKLGIEIVSYIRKWLDEKSKEKQLNFTLLATPAEGLSGRFLKMDKKQFGIIDGVTDKNYYTNSFHVPVSFNVNAAKKIELEAPYHTFTNAGHITYVELDGDPLKNLEAFEMIIKKMKESGIGYGSINHPIDRDPICGFNGIIGDKCPKCGRIEKNNSKFERIRRITGYLTGTVDRWNNAKQEELKDRIKHSLKK